MHQSNRIQKTLLSSLSALLTAFAVGCGAAPDASTSTPASNDSVSADDPLGAIIERSMTPLAAPCTFVTTTGVMTVTVATGETAIISKRATDSVIVQNGVACTTSATVATLKQIKITGSAGDETVIIDYTNGIFAAGTTSAASGILVDMGGNTGASKEIFGIRGTNSADALVMGASGIAVNADASKDISFTTEPESYTVSLGDGNDSFSAAGGTALGVGTTYIGAKPVVLYGGAGNDTFNQGAAITKNEEIHGGSGTDTVSYALRTSSAPVTVTVGAGVDDGDTGGTEKDNIFDDVETLFGSDGDDVVTAGGLAMTLNGGKGADTLTGGAGNDTINGDVGADIIAGKAGNDVLNGGDDNDTFNEDTDANGGDTFNGGLGTDTVSYAARTGTGVTVTMDGVAANDGKTGASENDNVKADVENIVGTAQTDVITGNVSANKITGGLGSDTLSGGDGDDLFYEGADLVAADVDSDTISGGNGVDEVDYSGRTADLVIKLDNTADSGDQSTTAPESDKLDVENATGGGGDDTITGNNGANELSGGAGGDTITGLDGDDTIDGGGGTNTIDCGNGDGDIGFNGTKTNCEF
jgi:Ca2+-binding RTX toxin-like protein